MPKARIYRPAKAASQSGRGKTHTWVLEPEIVTPRVPEPVMGWISAGDSFSELRNRLRFRTAEEAVAFAVRNGYDYTLEQPVERRIKARSYVDNFRITRPQDEEKQPVG